MPNQRWCHVCKKNASYEWTVFNRSFAKWDLASNMLYYSIGRFNPTWINSKWSSKWSLWILQKLSSFAALKKNKKCSICTVSVSVSSVQYTAKEGPVRIKYKCLVSIYVFPEMNLLFPKKNYNVLSPSSYTHISVRDLYISRIGLPILLQGNVWTDPGNIYKSLTDTWMWKMGLRPRYSQKRNT